MSKSLDAGTLAKLSGLSVKKLHDAATAGELPIIAEPSFIVFSHQQKFSLADAVAIEVARQLSDDGGLPLATASKLVDNAGTRAYESSSDDFWIAIVRNRNTWPGGSRGSIKVTGFGQREFWSSSHCSGTFAEVTNTISGWIERDKVDFPDIDPARIFMANVSTADRRLRKRAADMGIEL